MICNRAGSINVLEWEAFCKGCMDGNKVRKGILTAFPRNLAVIIGGENIG